MKHKHGLKNNRRKTKRGFGSGCPDRGRALDYEGV